MLCLVVDDDPSVRSFVRAIVNSEGFEVLEADGGGPALEMVRRLDGSVDLIITDIQMPYGDGRTLAGDVARMFPETRIILMSGYERDSQGSDFVAKPFSWEGMRDAVRRVVAPPKQVA